jgi:hypothetical protein
MGFIGVLVAGETCIEVDPVVGFCRLVGHMVGREASHVLVEQSDQFDHLCSPSMLSSGAEIPNKRFTNVANASSFLIIPKCRLYSQNKYLFFRNSGKW